MPAEPIVDLQQVRSWSAAQTEAEDDVLARLVVAASDWLEGETARVFVPPVADVTIYLDGSGGKVAGRCDEVLYLPFRPVASVTSVKENGIALTLAAGYTTTADVVKVLDDGKLVRRATQTAVEPVGYGPSAGWAPGVQNIEVAYKPGYAVVPTDVEQACVELTWLMYRESRRQGRESMSRSGMSINFVRDLAPVVADVVERYKDWGRP
jgi:hypothetical protein